MASSVDSNRPATSLNGMPARRNAFLSVDSLVVRG
jgi:hypothetical protein